MTEGCLALEALVTAVHVLHGACGAVDVSSSGANCLHSRVVTAAEQVTSSSLQQWCQHQHQHQRYQRVVYLMCVAEVLHTLQQLAQHWHASWGLGRSLEGLLPAMTEPLHQYCGRHAAVVVVVVAVSYLVVFCCCCCCLLLVLQH